ncbi:type III-A CRISPR-associated RAMP protein Csm3 [Nostoc sp. DedQUE09]|uniref:type III-A CRISPR-associated RAMP protein Csm3 n=1 Tax=Nostoc sp. DedQUE09 TaxID=3075394 RepID=UPI002AD1D614|nr:type III-A CRISPR-associated RAMP protein Csm3 [Nostoc sp. DedQUE09]MDZ7950632.1 type III-A CRISPR-associated RAMP protein Csm3 [Nostoc sp. DedQUE09]
MTFSTKRFESKELVGKVTINSILNVETGIHIGGGGERLDIGGLDKPVIRNPVTRHPYLPGSSVKGKLRAILERLWKLPLNRHGGSGTYRYESDDLVDGYTEIKIDNTPIVIKFDGSRDCKLSRLFGSTGTNFWVNSDVANQEKLERVPNIEQRMIITQADQTNRFARFAKQGEEAKDGEIKEQYVKVKGRNTPARLIVRDSHLLDSSIALLERVDTGLYMTEWKFENGIDRVTAAANPRQVERVPAGAKFDFELVYTVENPKQAVEDLQNIAIALAFLEDDALGGHGSRGYGKVKFENFRFNYRSLEQYRQIANAPQGTSALQTLDTIPNTQALLDNFRSLREYIEQRLLPGNES